MSNAKVEHSTDGDKVYLQLEDIIESVEYAFAQSRNELQKMLDKSHTLDGVNICETDLELFEWHTYKLVKAGKNLKYLYIAREREIFTMHENECKYCMGTGISTRFNEDCNMCNGTGESDYYQKNKKG